MLYCKLTPNFIYLQEFMGKDAPPSIIYTPEIGKTKRADPLFSIGKSPRFHLP